MSVKQDLIDELKQDVITLIDDDMFDDDAMIELYTKNALSFVCTYCNQDFTEDEELDKFPDKLKAPTVDIVVLKYRKNQSEGLAKEKAASVTLSYREDDIPDYIKSQLKKFRKVRFI